MTLCRLNTISVEGDLIYVPLPT